MFLASLNNADSLFYFFIGLTAIGLWLFPLIATPIIAHKKGRSGFGWFMLSLVIGIIAFIIICCVSGAEKKSELAEYKEIYRDSK